MNPPILRKLEPRFPHAFRVDCPRPVASENGRETHEPPLTAATLYIERLPVHAKTNLEDVEGMVNLKRIRPDGVETALEKAAHYRLLNEPLHAESICLDVLEVDPKNQRALITLLLALTDQFPTKLYDAYQHAEQLIPKLTSEYDQQYYDGIVNERWASTQLEKGTASKSLATWLGRAMNCYERAEKLSDGKNPDPILRWNTCARLQEKIGGSEPAQAPLSRDLHSEYGDDVPPR